MIKAIRTAYGAGWRAGMSQARLVRPGGTRGIKVLAQPTNPCKGFVTRLAWDEGFYQGRMKSLTTWLNERKTA